MDPDSNGQSGAISVFYKENKYYIASIKLLRWSTVSLIDRIKHSVSLNLNVDLSELFLHYSKSDSVYPRIKITAQIFPL